MSITKNDPKIIRAWTFYDWANSVFPLVITSAIFPSFYDACTSAKLENCQADTTVHFFGQAFENQNIYSFVYAFALLIVVIISPILSGIADYLGNKKRFLQFFCYLGSISCMSLYFFSKDHLELSFIPFITATIGFWGSLIYYNSYLPEIASVDNQDKVSARGFALGYFGSSLLLIVCLGIIMGIGKEYTRVSFLLTGLWWMGFAQFTFRRLPNKAHNVPQTFSEKGLLYKGFRELKGVFEQIRNITELKQFLWGYFFYNMGVQTVMVVAVLFARKEVIWGDATMACEDIEKAKTTSLIISILVIQFVGIVGSFFFSRISRSIGNIRALMIAILIWIFICSFTFAVVRTPIHFYIVAFLVGFVMGGIQALSRSTYSKYLPQSEDTASFFSFYDVMEKMGMILGTVCFGMISQITGGMRNSILSLIVFFVLGFLFLIRLNKRINPS